MSPAVPQVIQLFATDNRIYDDAGHNNQYNRTGGFDIRHGVCVLGLPSYDKKGDDNLLEGFVFCSCQGGFYFEDNLGKVFVDFF
jgi:hypothetical protein